MTAEPAKALADIEKIVEKIAETEGVEAADAAFQRMARETEPQETPGGEVIETPSGEVMERDESTIAKPVKAEAREAKGSITPSDLENLELVLADLEVGVGEPGYDKAIEHLDELDASAEDAVESAIAKAEAYESQPDKPTARTVEMLAYLAKQRKRGAARPAACEEFGVDPTDPMAPDKVRTAYKLKTVGKTLADLDNFHPAFWALPLETDDRSPSRKLVLSRFLWRRNDETKAKEKAAERQKKREAKGYRADYDDLSSKEKKRERDRLHKKWSRERGKALEAAGPSA